LCILTTFSIPQRFVYVPRADAQALLPVHFGQERLLIATFSWSLGLVLRLGDAIERHTLIQQSQRFPTEFALCRTSHATLYPRAEERRRDGRNPTDAAPAIT
jgi:hypothetical protein